MHSDKNLINYLTVTSYDLCNSSSLSYSTMFISIYSSEGESGTSAEVSPSPALLATSLVSRKFLAWLASSDHMHEVLDLIRIDNEIDSN